MDEEQNLKDFFGAVIQAIGTTISAVGSTPLLTIHNELFSPVNLNLWGQTLQGTGNAIQADSEKNFTLSKTGNIVQAIGNSTALTGFILYEEGETGLDLVIKGDLLQATGSAAVFADAFGKTPTDEYLYVLYGNLLQAIGNATQALGGMVKASGKDGQNLYTVGSWVQAAGSIIAAVGRGKYL